VHSEVFSVDATAARIGGRGEEPVRSREVAVREVKGRDLLQFGGWDANWDEGVAAVAAAIGCAVPSRVDEGAASDGLRVMRVAHRRVRVCAPCGDRRLDALRAAIEPSLGVVTELGHSRTLLRLKGPGVRQLMPVLMPIDFAEPSFALQAIAQSHIHHVPVLAMAVLDDDGAHAFDLHVPRTFGESLLKWIVAHGAVQGPGGH
jgi:heterotetrameric sarcosine oxidase gamma subunit